MEPWLAAALDYIPRWVAFQMRQLDQPGCVVAIDHRGATILDHAVGTADLGTGEDAGHQGSFGTPRGCGRRRGGRLRRHG